MSKCQSFLEYVIVLFVLITVLLIISVIFFNTTGLNRTKYCKVLGYEKFEFESLNLLYDDLDFYCYNQSKNNFENSKDPKLFVPNYKYQEWVNATMKE